MEKYTFGYLSCTPGLFPYESSPTTSSPFPSSLPVVHQQHELNDFSSRNLVPNEHANTCNTHNQLMMELCPLPSLYPFHLLPQPPINHQYELEQFPSTRVGIILPFGNTQIDGTLPSLMSPPSSFNQIDSQTSLMNPISNELASTCDTHNQLMVKPSLFSSPFPLSSPSHPSNDHQYKLIQNPSIDTRELILPSGETQIDGKLPSQVPPPLIHQINLQSLSTDPFPKCNILPSIDGEANFVVKDCAAYASQTRRNWKIKKNADANHWTIEEDRKLLCLIDRKKQKQQWGKIAQNFDKRAGKQCRERWTNHLQPNLKKKDAWTEEEEAIIQNFHREQGARWAKMSKKLTGRPENDIKNHWNATKRRLKGDHSKAKTSFEQYIVATTAASNSNTNTNTNTNIGPIDFQGHQASSRDEVNVTVQPEEENQGDLGDDDDVQLWDNIDNCIIQESAFWKDLSSPNS